MKNKKLTASEKGMLVNEQRFSMIVLLCNVLDAENGVSDAVKSAVAASLLNTIEMSFIPADDDVDKDDIIIKVSRPFKESNQDISLLSNFINVLTKEYQI